MPAIEQRLKTITAARSLSAKKSLANAGSGTPLSHHLTQPITQRTIQRVMTDAAALDATDVASLQRSVGNQAVSNLLEQRHAPANTPQAPESPQATKSPRARVQRKLEVGPAHDRYEEEADRISGDISKSAISKNSVRRSAQASATKSPAAKSAAAGADGGTLEQETTREIDQARGGGSQISRALAAPLEAKLGMDLSQTRLHVDGQADNLNDHIGARAFTVGPDIFLKREEYRPHSRAGRKLLYHEMTHVAQQTGGHQKGSRGVVQREVSAKQGQITANLGTLFSTKKEAKVEKQGVEDYLSGLEAKQTDKTKHKEQKQEKSQLKSLLHFKKSETKSTTEEQRVIIRTMITIERAKGHSFQALEELRRFLTQYLGNGTLKIDNIKSYLNGDSAGVETMMKWGKTWGGSIEMLNIFASHAPELRARQEAQATKLIAAARAIRQRALTVTQGSDDTSMIRLRFRIKDMGRTADSLEQVIATGDYVRSRALILELTSLYTAITQAVHYGENLSKSPYSKGTAQDKGRRLGGGAFSKVVEVNYDTTRNQTNKPMNMSHAVFKQEQTQYDWGSSRSAGFAGISEYDPNFAGRSVATYEVDKLLGIGLTPETQYGTHEGMGGSVQGWAEGKEPQKSVYNEELEVEQTKYREFDYDDPELQRQLATLQLLDLITGQVDRHPGNYYISQGPGGTKVIAIDNDIAFGENKDIQRLIDDTWGRELAEDNTRGMPLFVDEVVAENVLATSPADLLEAIAHHGLTDNEKAKTLARFAQVKTHLNRLKANTARINTIKSAMVSIYAKRKLLPSGDPRTADVDRRIEFIEKKQAELFGQGVLLGPTEWGATTAAFLNSDNSYYGMLLEQVEFHRSIGMMLTDD